MSLPTKPGFYWAKWRVSDDDVAYAHDYTPCNLWEVVQVQRPYDDDDPTPFKCEIPGVPGQYSLDGFVWDKTTDGTVFPLPPPRPVSDFRDRAAEAREVEAYRLYKRMTPDERLEFIEKQRRRK